MWYIPDDLMGAPTSKVHSALGWNKNGNVVFTFCKKGNALDCHFSANKKALRHIKEAITDFISWVRMNIPWCKALIAATQKRSVQKMISKLNFKHLADAKHCKIYARYV